MIFSIAVLFISILFDHPKTYIPLKSLLAEMLLTEIDKQAMNYVVGRRIDWTEINDKWLAFKSVDNRTIVVMSARSRIVDGRCRLTSIEEPLIASDASEMPSETKEIGDFSFKTMKTGSSIVSNGEALVGLAVQLTVKQKNQLPERSTSAINQQFRIYPNRILIYSSALLFRHASSIWFR